MLLAGDVGGTKTVLALFSAEKGAQAPQQEATFASDEYDSLEAIIDQFLKDKGVKLTCAAFGVAGPVVKDRAEITNLPWIIDAATIQQALGLESVYLLNDLEAIATAVPHLKSTDLATINPGKPPAHGPIAVIAPGTGLGEAFSIWSGDRYRACPSEGGHTSFAPATEQQQALLAYLQPRFDHVSYERVCSGKGIPNLYNYLRDSGHYTEPPWLREELATAEDPTPIIVKTALEARADICEATLDLFIEILAGEAGNLALKVLATGGIYLGGGIPPRILPRLKNDSFTAAFLDKGRLADVLTDVPVYVILNPKTALYGAAYYGLQEAERG